MLPSVPGAPVAILPHKQILSLHAAVVSARLTSSRATLLGGIEPAFADGLPICANQSSQILSDLHGLNAAEPLSDGSVPFRIWLGNALALSGERAEADVFRSAMLAAEATDAIPRPGRPPGTSHGGDEIADELLRIGRAVLLARDDDLSRSLYEVEALLARCPHHVEARLLRERIQRAMRAMDEAVVSGGVRGTKGSVSIEAIRRAYLARERRLRAPPSRFTGRERELRELTSQIGPGGVLISGLGGIGKTALALKLVQTLAPRYPDLQIAIDLKGISEDPLPPAATMGEVISAFLPAVPLPERPEELAGLYHAVLQGQRAVLLLEDARDQAQIEPLLPPAGSVLIVTSRRRFALPGVHVLSLDRLDASEAPALLLRLAPRIDRETACKLAELCGGVPLALRVALGALSTRLDLTTEAYADRLQDAQARYEQVDAALRVSFALLDPVLQILWAHLGLFTSYFSERDAGAIIGAFPVIHEALGDLVAYGMLEYNAATDLYSLHRAGRRFAMSHLTETDRMEAELQLQYLSNSSRAHRLVASLDLVELESAISVARCTGQRQAEVLYLKRMADPDFDLGDARSPDLAEQALAICREFSDRSRESQMLNKLCLLYERLNDDRRAIEHGEQALVIFRELGDLRAESHMLETLGRLYERLKDDHRAIEIHQQRLAVARERGFIHEQARSARQLGLNYQKLGELDKAIAALQICVDIERASGHRWAERHAAEIDRLRASLKK
jgi:tetratricopeptide (TPR) repeat protein